MCKQLLQKYACNCDKLICTTACAYALGTTNQLRKVCPDHVLSRSNSTVSNLPSPTEDPEPKYCTAPQLSVHYTQQSKEPCINCYMLPQYYDLPARLVDWYRREHPLEKPESAEKLSGIQALREKREEDDREIRNREAELGRRDC
ncbi:hypothetical protein GQ44DRAFT_701967 [Phaeosphaeriaceae sp. PMI808]|nr:hypothetical protein GQ44DRAFT_701967 [Phaeosphaeriaceae sp. PMI808]